MIIQKRIICRLYDLYRVFQKQCSKDWLPIHASCFWVDLDKCNWNVASAICSDFGSHLAVVTSQEEHDLIFAALEAITSNGLWLGGYYDVKVASGKWVNGETWSYTNFDANVNNTAVNSGELNADSVLQMRNINHEANRRWVFRSKYGGDKGTLCELEL